MFAMNDAHESAVLHCFGACRKTKPDSTVVAIIDSLLWMEPRKHMDVSENSGTPKSSILIGFSIIFTIHFGVPLFLETPIYPNDLILHSVPFLAFWDSCFRSHFFSGFGLFEKPSSKFHGVISTNASCLRCFSVFGCFDVFLGCFLSYQTLVSVALVMFFFCIFELVVDTYPNGQISFWWTGKRCPLDMLWTCAFSSLVEWNHMFSPFGARIRQYVATMNSVISHTIHGTGIFTYI